jgi:hypothetical protein
MSARHTKGEKSESGVTASFEHQVILYNLLHIMQLWIYLQGNNYNDENNRE